MKKQIFGILIFCILIATIGFGFYGISLNSPAAAVIYLSGCFILLILFTYVYCTKCPIRGRCVHVLMGLITRLMPRRREAPYMPYELLGTFAFFGFVAFFPLYWLIQNTPLLIVFLGLFISEWTINHFACCRGCGNKFCRLRVE